MKAHRKLWESALEMMATESTKNSWVSKNTTTWKEFKLLNDYMTPVSEPESDGWELTAFYQMFEALALADMPEFHADVIEV